MKLMIPALVAVLFVAACDWPAERKQAAADAALVQIQLLNAQGIDPVSLDEDQLALIASGCALIPIAYPDAAEDVLQFCTVVLEAAK